MQTMEACRLTPYTEAITLETINQAFEVVKRANIAAAETNVWDEFTERLVVAVLEDAREGRTMKELHGLIVYRKRCANLADKPACQRVLKALRTDRWSIETAVRAMQALAAEDRRDTRLSVQAREAFHDQRRYAGSLIPENKRGGGNKNGRKRKPTPKAPPNPEADARAIAQHNAKVLGY